MKTKILKFIFPALVLFLPLITFALDAPSILPLAQDDLEASGAVNIILGIAQWMMVVLGVIAVIVALWSAFLFITGGGNEEQTAKAKKTLIWAIVGVLVAIVAFSIVSFASSLLAPPVSPSPAGPGVIHCTDDADCPEGSTCIYNIGGGYCI